MIWTYIEWCWIPDTEIKTLTKKQMKAKKNKQLKTIETILEQKVKTTNDYRMKWEQAQSNWIKWHVFVDYIRMFDDEFIKSYWIDTYHKVSETQTIK